MAGTPTPRSYDLILGDMLSTYSAKVGINDFNPGSVVTSFFEAMAQAVYRASADNFSILREFDLNRATGERLQRLAAEENVRVSGDVVATGTVTISDTSFEKIATSIFAGSSSPNIGSTVIRVSDASSFTPSGELYIGRGTNNIEGPLRYSSINEVGAFWEITLIDPTTRFHNISESVVLAQGGVRTIRAQEVVVAPASGASADITFTLTQQAIILDGETSISGVLVAASQPGTDGNVPRNAIRSFTFDPFDGATVTNENSFTTGANADTEDQIRDNIRRARVSRGLGTALAIRNAVLGAQAIDENAVITSNEIVSDGERTTLFIDNGRGYEELTQGVGLEFIVDSALGGERFFKLATSGRQTSVAKATVFSSNTAPFNIVGNDRLSILVGGILSEHVFMDSDFRSPTAASAFEVASSINGNPNIGFSARTINNGTGISIAAREEEDEFLQVTVPTAGNNAAIAIGLPTDEIETLRLFRNGVPLSRNGRAAQITTATQVNWSNTIAGSETLVISVDRTDFITYTFTDADFLAEGTHPTISASNTLASWAAVINRKVTGITATVDGNRLSIVSNLGNTNRASLEISDTSTFVSQGIFPSTGVLISEGRESDFTLSRNTAQFRLATPLQRGESLSAGTEFTKGAVTSNPLLGGQVSFSNQADLWILVDNTDAEFISTGVTADTTIEISKPAANTIRYESNNATAFSNVQVGDTVIFWSNEILEVNRLEARISNRTDSYIEIRVTPQEFALAMAEGPLIWREGIAVIRTDQTIQRLSIPSGTYQLSDLALLIEDTLVGATASVERDELLTLSSNSEDSDGEIFIATLNDAARALGFSENSRQSSRTSLFAFHETDSSDSDFPLFIHEKITNNIAANPPFSFVSDFDSAEDLEVLGLSPNEIISFLDPLDAVKDNLSSNERVQINSLDSNTVNVKQSQLVKRLRQDDRFYVASTYQFGANDSLVAILNNDVTNNTFPINLFRTALANNTTSIDTNGFRAFDQDSGPSIEFAEFFGSEFDFSNYKALMLAKNVVHPIKTLVNQDAILYRSIEWGRAGERYNVGYTYPTAPNQEISHTSSISDRLNIRINLKSGNAVANNIDGTTEWDVTITNMGAIDEVTYTHNGTGTIPAIDTILSSGGYVTINNSGEFDPANTGTFRVLTSTSTSFTTIRKAGDAVAENNRATLVNTTIVLFENSDTTAQEISEYVTDNLSNNFVTAELIDDNGTSGSGVISLSTEEDSDFAFTGVSLVDGVNWIETSDLDAVAPANQFRFKVSLQLPSFTTATANAYAFNAGEQVRLVPTTAKQVSEFINTFTVSGISTLSQVSTTERDGRLQIRTDLLGSGGSVQIAGGNANLSAAQVLQASSFVPNTELINTTISRASSIGFFADQWVRLEAQRLQQKDTGFAFATTFTFTPNEPTAGQTRVLLNNRANGDIYFGEPRNFFRDRSRTFHVEKQGVLTCIIWDENGDDPYFSKQINTNDSAATVEVSRNADTGNSEYVVTSGDLSFIEASRGDLVTFTNFNEDANNGTFSVIGVSDDGKTLVTNNLSPAAESASLPIASISINAEISEGDIIQLGEPFANLNQGNYRVIRRYKNSVYIENDNSVEEIVTISDNLRDLEFDATTEFDVTNTDSVMRITWNGTGTTPNLSQLRLGDIFTIGTDFDTNNQGEFMVTNSGVNYVELSNSSAVAETGITVSDVLEAHTPSVVFSEYDVTVRGDNLVVSGDVFNGNNVGTFNVSEIISKNEIVVNTILAPETLVQLEERSGQVYIEEALAYTGYKRIQNKLVDLANDERVSLIFDTNDQFLKINKDAGEVSISALGKLSFPTENTVGLDSYRHHIGLVAEANRISYGDPRDTLSSPGVVAAGAEVFIEASFPRRVRVGVGVRLNTGVPFPAIVEQVRNNVSALVNSNDVGVSIAISDIISVINGIPGVRAVSITSPDFSITNDVIVINPNEKALILDVVNDITVSRVE